MAGFLLASTGHTRVASDRELLEWLARLADYDLQLWSVTSRHVNFYARQLTEVDGKSPVTVACKLSALSGLSGYAFDEALIT